MDEVLPATTIAGAPVSAGSEASPEAVVGGEFRFVFPEGQNRGRMEAVAAPGKPVVFLVPVPAKTALTIGVASKTNEARFSVFEPGAKTALGGTRREDGAVRWIGQSATGGDLRVEVYTVGGETPVRLEVSIDRHLDFNATSGD